MNRAEAVAKPLESPSGHDFSRADTSRNIRALAPEVAGQCPQRLKPGYLQLYSAWLKPCPDNTLQQFLQQALATHQKRSQSNAGERNAGFTLLELLVSVTIVGLLSVTILFGWRVAASAWQRADRHLREQRVVLATHQVLVEQIASMVPYRVSPVQGSPIIFFQGEPEAARFVSRYSLADRARSGLYLVEYRIVEQRDGKKQLLVNEFPLHGPEDLRVLLEGVDFTPSGSVLRFPSFHEGPRTITLLAGLQECRFEYYRPPRFNDPGGWTEQWVNITDELPRGMAIRAVPPAGARNLQSVSVIAAIQGFALRKP